MIGWGTGDIFVTIASRRLGSSAAYIWGFAFAFLFASLLIPFTAPLLNYPMFLVAFALQIAHTISNLFFFKGLQIGNASIVGTLAQCFSLVTVLISIFVFGETLTILKILALITLTIGIILMSFRFDHVAQMGLAHVMTNRGVIYGFVTLIGWGVVFAFLRIPAESIGWFWTGYPLYILGVSLFLFKSMRGQALAAIKKPLWFLPVIPFSILASIADFSYNAGILHGFTSTVAPIAGGSPILFVILSTVIFKEPSSMVQKAGIILSLTGIILVAVS